MKKFLVCSTFLLVVACGSNHSYPNSVAGERMRAFDQCLERTTGYRGAAEIKACQDWSLTITTGTKKEAAEATS